jgi:Ca-activated chloride channel homolog
MRRSRPWISGLALAAAVSGCAVNFDGPTGGGGTSNPGPNESASAGVGGGAGEPTGDGTGDHSGEPPTGSGGGALADPKGQQCVNAVAPVYLTQPHAQALSSPAQARGQIHAGKAPEPSTIRQAEFLSYYRVDYPHPQPGQLAIVASLAPTLVGSGELVLQIGVQSAPVAHAPTAITVVVDTSSSMAGEPLKRAKAAVVALAESLDQGDAINVITTNPAISPVTLTAKMLADPALAAAADPLAVDGYGNVDAALKRGYTVAAGTSHARKRVVLITDGGELPSGVDLGAIADHYRSDRVALVGVGVGDALSYRDDLLGAATAAGHGADVYLDSVDEATVALRDRFAEVMSTAAEAVSVKISLPPSLLPEIDMGPDFRDTPEQLVASDLAAGRSMIFRQRVRLCAAGTKSVPPPSDVVAVDVTWTDPATGMTQVTNYTTSLGEAGSQGIDQVKKATAIEAYADALKALDPSRLCQAGTVLHTVDTALQDDADVHAIAQLFDTDPALAASNCTAPLPPGM